MGDVIHPVCENNNSNASITVIKCSKFIRKDIYNQQQHDFNGHIDHDCQAKSVPQSLLSLITALLYDPKYTGTLSQEVLTISQLIIFNTKKNTKTSVHRNRSIGPPLPLYVGLKFHSELRSKALIQRMHSLGISVSYARIMNVEEDILRATCTQYHNQGVVCTSQLRKGLPVLGSIDNIDMNPSSITSKGSFHGTIISIFQTPTESNIGTEQTPLAISVANEQSELPESYSIVPAFLKKLEAKYPHDQGYKLPSSAIKLCYQLWIAKSWSYLFMHSVFSVKSIQTYSFGSSLDHPRNNRYTILVKYLKTWESKNARHYHSSLRSLDVIQHHNLSTKESYPHGMLGWHIRKQQMHS